MKGIVMAALLSAALDAGAQQVAKIGRVELGRPYAEAVEEIKGEFGEPAEAGETVVRYKDRSYKGVHFAEVAFVFRDGRLSEAKFSCKPEPRQAAVRRMASIVKAWEGDYTITEDVEDGGTPFYKGGSSPVGIGPLFTIYSMPGGGGQSASLRYGPFRFRN